ncbi:hypothetical protein [Ideonella alba]|uniref:Uncharacterized protein n=1 Tax=Ideonella alba TaxID=2824118 RepID=A0A941BH38_9BURK|nr:hypothetical protein [Ideonella alba]MBQ0932732.1 hypothetical protein [Ideonella alba]
MTWRREVFFLGGFDPRGPSRDHRTCAQAVADHPVTPAGETVQIGPRQRVSPLLDAWDVHWTQPDGVSVHTRHHVMRWDDIVRAAWPRGWGAAWRDRWVVYARAFHHGAFWPIWRFARPAFWLAMLPLLIGLGLGVLWAALAALAVSAGAAVLGVALALPLWLWTWRQLEVRLDADWLLRLYGFTWRVARDEVPGIQARIDQLADELVQRATDGQARELLVVGHSTGTQMAAMVMARALRKAPWLGQRGPQVALLTLGHCTPVLAWVRDAGWFRDDLARLADHPPLTWHDIAAPGDWAAFARVAPWLTPGRARLARYSPRFHQTLDAATYQRLRSHRHEMHQQYLRAPQHSGGYDPVVWMAGPLTLAERSPAPARS